MHRSTKLQYWQDICVSSRFANELRLMAYVQEEQEQVSGTGAMDISRKMVIGKW